MGFRGEKGAFHDLVTSLTSSPLGRRALGRPGKAWPSALGQTNTTLLKGGNTAGSSSLEDSSPPSDAAIDNWSSAGVLNEMLGPP